jgi:hypothetical protein
MASSLGCSRALWLMLQSHLHRADRQTQQRDVRLVVGIGALAGLALGACLALTAYYVPR